MPKSIELVDDPPTAGCLTRIIVDTDKQIAVGRAGHLVLHTVRRIRQAWSVGEQWDDEDGLETIFEVNPGVRQIRQAP